MKMIIDERLKMFLDDPNHPTLKNKPLPTGKPGYRYIHITGDWRAVYEVINKDKAEFIDIGPHTKIFPKRYK